VAEKGFNDGRPSRGGDRRCEVGRYLEVGAKALEKLEGRGGGNGGSLERGEEGVVLRFDVDGRRGERRRRRVGRGAFAGWLAGWAFTGAGGKAARLEWRGWRRCGRSVAVDGFGGRGGVVADEGRAGGYVEDPGCFRFSESDLRREKQSAAEGGKKK
jgi:hypothetical protein